MREWMEGVAARFAIDARALAAFRVALGSLLLLDIALRVPDLAAFYTDAGVLPRAVAAEATTYARFSLHMLSGGAWAQAVLFLAAAGAAVCLALGWHARPAAIASLVLLASLRARNPFVLHGGDLLLLHLVFWSVFLPLDARWALRPRPRTASNVACAALLVQVVVVYLANAVWKARGGAWTDPHGLDMVFREPYGVFLAGALAGAPWLPLLAWGWFLLLWSAPLLIVLRGRARVVLVAAFMAGHVGMLLTLRIGHFPLVSLAALVPFLPPGAWDRVERWFARMRARARVAWAASRGHGSRLAVEDDRKPDGQPDTPPDTPPDRPPDWRKTQAGLADGRARVRGSAWAQGAVAVLLAVNVLGNAMLVGVIPSPAAFQDAFAEEAGWTMFARPPARQQWLIANGTLPDGQVDLLYGVPSALDGPHHVRGYPDNRWRKYLDAADDRPVLLAALADHLCTGPAQDVEIAQVTRTDDVVTVRTLHGQAC